MVRNFREGIVHQSRLFSFFKESTFIQWVLPPSFPFSPDKSLVSFVNLMLQREKKEGVTHVKSERRAAWRRVKWNKKSLVFQGESETKWCIKNQREKEERLGSFISILRSCPLSLSMISCIIIIWFLTLEKLLKLSCLLLMDSLFTASRRSKRWWSLRSSVVSVASGQTSLSVLSLDC